MTDTPLAGLEPNDEPSRRLRVSMPALLAFLPILLTACRIYCHTLPGGRRLFDEVAQAVTEAATRSCSNAGARVDVELCIRRNRFEVAIDDTLLKWEVDDTAL